MCKIIAILSFFCASLMAHQLNYHKGEHIGWISMFSLPQYIIDQHFQEVKEQVDFRWDMLASKYEFPIYSQNLKEDLLVKEFYTFSNLRTQLWLADYTNLPCESNPLSLTA